MGQSGERLFNVVLGLSFLFWAFAGIIKDDQLSMVRIGVASLNTCVGILLIIRANVIKYGNSKSILLSLPSLIAGGLLFRLTHDFTNWSLISELLFGFGLIITIVSFITLGKNFAILPQLRKLVGSGLYGYVRHPAYVGESLLLIACFIASEKLLYSGIAFICFIPLIIIRIMEEERLLLANSDYETYAERVKWRMIPWVW